MFISEDAEAHGYANMDDLLGGTGSLITVTGGYNSGDGPRAMYAPSPGLIISVGVDGYIYRSTSIFAAPSVVDAGAATTEDYNAVHGLRSQIMAGGESGAMAVSEDFGQTWSSITGPSSDNITALAVLEKNIAIVATDGPGVYRTEDFGQSWEEVNLAFTVDSIAGISFRKNEAAQSLVGYMAGTVNGEGFVARSIDAGATWVASSQHIASLPTSTGLNAVSAFQTAPNGVVVAGDASSSAGLVAVA